MVKLNSNIQKLPGSYLFTEVAAQVEQFRTAHPDTEVISLGIGDVTLPLPEIITDAMARAAREMSTAEGFRGYGPEQGYPFLRQAIAEAHYSSRGVTISPDEIYVSDGAKTDCGALSDLFAGNNTVAICDPAYSVYIDTNVMAGRTGKYDSRAGKWSKLIYLPCTAENGFVPMPPNGPCDIIYLCSPANPTGTPLNRAQLQAWVDYANRCGAIILFDGAYEAFITTPDIPHSIYELPGARTCAIEIRSFSKTAGFTGVRCGYTVIPKELERDSVPIFKLWRRRQATKNNGVSYVTQRGAQAACSLEGRQTLMKNISYYQSNAAILMGGLRELGLSVFGGVDAPYLWVETPNHIPSWDFFHLLLEKAGLVVTPGVGFGPSGEGYVRLTSFGTRESTEKALTRIKSVLG